MGRIGLKVYIFLLLFGYLMEINTQIVRCSWTVPIIHTNPSTSTSTSTSASTSISTPSNTSTTSSSRLEKYSSLAYRKKAADLMAQIKSDVKGPGNRIFSSGSDCSGDKENEGPRERRGHHRASSSTSTVAMRGSRNGSGKTEAGA